MIKFIFDHRGILSQGENMYTFIFTFFHLFLVIMIIISQEMAPVAESPELAWKSEGPHRLSSRDRGPPEKGVADPSRALLGAPPRAMYTWATFHGGLRRASGDLAAGLERKYPRENPLRPLGRVGFLGIPPRSPEGQPHVYMDRVRQRAARLT